MHPVNYHMENQGCSPVTFQGWPQATACHTFDSIRSSQSDQSELLDGRGYQDWNFFPKERRSSSPVVGTLSTSIWITAEGFKSCILIGLAIPPIKSSTSNQVLMSGFLGSPKPARHLVRGVDDIGWKRRLSFSFNPCLLGVHRYNAILPLSWIGTG